MRLWAVRVRLDQSAGFTLVELVMVIVIVGILAAVVAPRFFGADIFQSRGAADQVKAALRYGQKVAIAQHRNINVTISLAANPDCSATLAASNVSCAISSSVATSGIPMTVIFDALGRPDAAASAMVGTAAIAVEAETGYVHSP